MPDEITMKSGDWVADHITGYLGHSDTFIYCVEKVKNGLPISILPYYCLINSGGVRKFPYTKRPPGSVRAGYHKGTLREVRPATEKEILACLAVM